MPYAASIQIVNDANGAAYAFLEDDGFLWQCQWNSEAQRWDKGQVVPMAYGGEKLQALLVQNLFPTSGTTGDQRGNTPGIVLAYRVGKGSEAQVYASFGQWGSDGELQWKAPLALTASAVAKDDFDLLAGGDGTFRLVVQQREAQADLAAVVDALTNTPTADLQPRLEEALSGAPSDSDLSISSFRIGSSGTTLEVNLQPSNPSGNWLSAGTITAAEAIQPSTQPPLALGGNTQLDRAQLAQSGTGSASGGSLSGTALAGSPSAAAPGSSDSNWSWRQRGGSTSGQVFTAQAVPVGDNIRTWTYTPDRLKGNRAAANPAALLNAQAQAAPRGALNPPAGDDVPGRPMSLPLPELDKLELNDYSQRATTSEPLSGIEASETFSTLMGDIEEAQQSIAPNLIPENIAPNLIPDLFNTGREKKFGALGQFGTTTTSTGWTSFSQSKIGGIVDIKKKVPTWNQGNLNKLEKETIVLEKTRSHVFGGAFSTYYHLSNFGHDPTLNGIDYKFSAGYGLTGSTLRVTPEGNLWSWSATGQGGYSSYLSVDFSGSPLAESLPLVVAALLPWLASEGAALGSSIYAARQRWIGNTALKSLQNQNGADQNLSLPKAKNEDDINLGLGIVGLITSIVPPNWFWISNFIHPVEGMQKAKGGLVNGSADIKLQYKGIAGFYAALSVQLSYFSNGVGFNEWAGLSAGVVLPLGSQIPLIKLYQQYPAVSEQANPGTASRRESSATAQDGAAYPFSHAPASGSQLFGNPGAASNAPLAAGAVPLIGSTSALQRFSLASGSASSTPAIRLAQAGSGLTDGSHSNVPILALSLPGSAPAALSFTVSGGAVVDNSITITVPAGGGAYLGLPETEADSGIYVLTPDVFSTKILPDPGSAAGELNLLQRLPLITLDSNQSGAPLTLTPISAVLPAIPLSEASDPSSGSYPERDPATGLWAVPATGDNTAYTYVGVPVSLSAAAGAPTPSPLNPGVTASVRLSAGRILAVTLDQPIYLAQTPASFQGWISGTTLQVQDLSGSLAVGDVLSGPGLLNGTTITAIGPVLANGNPTFTVNLAQSAGSSSAPLGWTAQPPLSLTLGLSDYYAANDYSGSVSNPSYGVSSEALVLNNLVEDEAFLANPVASSSSAAAAVWLSAGVNDQLAAFPQLAGWPVQNRVAVSDAAGAITYLNATSANGTPTTVARGNDSLAQLIATPVSFSAASTPTAITISGSGQRFSGASLVFWVEASDPVIPAVSSNGSENYQAFMQALYGAQRINYRINVPTSSGAQNSWETPNLADLYTPDNAVIRHLQAFQVMAGGQNQTLLVWDETPITGIKDLPSITLSGWIDGTSLSVSSLSGPLKVGDWIGGSDVAEGTVITAILSAFNGSSGTYAVSRSQSLGSAASPVNLNATDLRPATVLKAGFINPNASSLQWNALFTDAQGQSTIQTIPWEASQSPGLGLENLSAATQLQRAADGSLVETPVLSWNQGVRTPYREAVLNSQPFIYLDLGALAPGLNSINLGGASPDTTGTYASSSGLNFAIRGALPKATASAVQNLDGTGVLATGTGSLYGPLSGLINNATPEQLAALGPAQLQGSLSGTTLTVTSLSGNLSVGELLSGAGVIPGTVITAVDKAGADGLGSYTVSQAQELASTSLLALPVAGGLPYASFSGSLNGTSLTVSQLSGSLQVGDQVVGEGILAGTTITAIGVVDASGNGSYTLNQSQIAGSSAAPLALVGTPAGSAPYTVEFWTQLGAGSNANGAGLVAFGQPSAAAVGAATAPSGWLLVNSFVVEPITYGQALQRGWISDADGNALSALYGWGWAMVADGANTTAMGGNGGSNLYSNALQLNNLVSGQSLDGVSTFLANYGLTPADLGGGIDGILADTIAKAPVTQLQFNNALDPDTGLPVSNLNGIAIDTSSALLNQGVLLAGDLQSSARQQQLTSMFEQLWAYQQQTGEAKVNFSLAPDSSASTTSPTAQTSEQYVGYELGFSLFNGVAVSVDGQGRLVFDVAPGVSLTSSGTGSVPADLRDGSWHYVVANFLPDLRRFTIGGDTVQLPSNVGTASLVIDNQLVASSSGVINPFALVNLNDNALLLANNVGGAIDQVAFYAQALTQAPLPSAGDGSWPQLSAGDARQLLQELGFSGGQSPAAGSEAGAITDHWLARNVNPNDALLATSSASFLPSAGNPLQGSWTQAAPLNAALAPQATPASASAGSLQTDLVVAIQPTTAWGPGNNCWFVNGASLASSFNPGGRTLQGITVTLTPSDGSAAVIRQLSPQEVLLGSNAVAVLQPRAQQSDFDYTLLSNTPALNLLISIEPSGSSDSNKLRPALTYTATVALTFSDGSGSTTIQNDSSALSLTLNAAGSSLLTDYRTATDNNSTLTRRSQALATAEVIEAAPLQLQYIDSGVVLNSASSTAAAGSPAAPSPARSFGASQVIGSFPESSATSNGTTTTVNQGWIAIAQPFSTNAISNPAGRIWVQYTGQSTTTTTSTTSTTQPSTTASQAPSTWLNALARSNFSPQAANQPLLNDANTPAAYGGLLIQADATAGWGQNFGDTMLVADVNNDGTPDLIIGAPQANGGGRVVIISGAWIQANLTTSGGQTVLNLANPDSLGPYVTILTGGAAGSDGAAATDSANFGAALAFDRTNNTLWIGAPNYQQTAPDQSEVPVGALYHYSYSSGGGIWGSGDATALLNPALGILGSTTSPDPTGAPVTEYWGAQLGSAIAVANDGTGRIAVAAPGVQASLLYSGTEAVQQAANGRKNPSDPYGQGALVKIQLPQQTTVANTVVWTVSSTAGTANSQLLDVVNQSISPKSTQAAEESTYMQNLKALQSDHIADATPYNNQAIQTAAVGAVYLFNKASDLSGLSGSVNANSVATSVNQGASFYGVQPWNTLQASGFGSSLTFANLSKLPNGDSLVIGASASGGPGAVYALDPQWTFSNPTAPSSPTWLKQTTLGNNQYLAHLASSLTLYGAASGDQFGSGLVNLGDTNGDTFEDLLIQAFNADSGAGNGTVLFGSDQLINTTNTPGGFQPDQAATGSVAAGRIGSFQRADGSSFTCEILSELGSGTGATGQGTFGPGDVNGDGLNDIPLGAGNNGQAYLTYGQDYLATISNLQLQKLTSNNGYLLDGLATTTQGSLRAIGDFNGDGYGDFFSIQPGTFTDTVRIELGANTQEILADYPYNFYSFQVAPGTQVLPGGDLNGDGYSDIALFLQQNLSTAAEGNAGAVSTTGILYGRPSDQLPLGSGFGLLAPTNADATPLTPLPTGPISGALSTRAPAMLAVGNTIYAVWCDALAGSTNLWFAQSRDGGTSWSPDTNLTSTQPNLASSSTPSLTLFNDKLYLGFLNDSNQLALSSWDPASADATRWSDPTVLSEGTSNPTSTLTPALIANGDALSVVWVDGTSKLQGSTPTTPDLAVSNGAGPAFDWAQVAGASSPNTPALASNGSTVYMAWRGSDNRLYWTSSSDGGQSWGSWQPLPSGMTTNDAPSLAVVNGSLYLTYLGAGNQELNITQLTNTATNSWSAQTVVSNQSARNGLGAVAINETVGSTEGLAIYYVANNSTGTILRTWSSTPLTASTWSASQQLNGQTASGPLAVTRFNGQSYLAYQGGTPGTPSNVAFITTASTPSSSGSWSVIASRNAGNHNGIGLSSDAIGLLLNTTDSGTGQQAIVRLTPPAGSGSWSQSSYTSRASISGNAPTAAIQSLPGSGNPPQLLLAAADPANGGAVDTSVLAPQSSWTAATTLLERLVATDGTVSFQPISATAAPSVTLLNGAPVLAANNNGTLSVLVGNATRTFSLSSSFSPGSTNQAGSTAAGLTTTDTGLALSYRNGDGSVSLERLTLLNLDGTPVDGVQINADGSLVLGTELQWQGINLGASSGLSTALATVPLSVNGTLLLGSTSSGSTNQVQLNAMPVLSDPESTAWLNSTVQLGDGQGGWMLQQYGTSDLIINTDGNTIAQYGGDPLNPSWHSLNRAVLNSQAAPAFARLGGVLYAVAHDKTGSIVLNSSADDGNTWSGWTSAQASSLTATNKPPTIAVFNNSLWICYIDANNNGFKLFQYTPDSNSWGQAISFGGTQTGQYLAALPVTDNKNSDSLFAVYYVGSNSQLYYTTTTDPSNSGSFTDSALIKDQSGNAQTASGPLGAVSLNNTAYLAYQSGTTSSPGTQIIITTGATVNNNNTQQWNNFLPSLQGGGPQNQTASKSINLAVRNQALALAYGDSINGQNVTRIYQGTGSGSTWSFNPFATVENPSNAPNSLTSSSIIAQASGSGIITSVSNGNNDDDLNYTVAQQNTSTTQNPAWGQLTYQNSSDWAFAPSFAEYNGKLYAVSRGANGTIVLNNSTDQGATWSGWSDVSPRRSPTSAPTPCPCPRRQPATASFPE